MGRLPCPQLLVEGLRQMCLQERSAASGEARSYSALTQAPSEWEEVVRISGFPTTPVSQCNISVALLLCPHPGAL